VIGDSIPVFGDSKSNWVLAWANERGYRVINHSVAGANIAIDMAGQVAAAANDNAKIILIELGTNDASGSDVIRTTYIAGVQALQASNPRATIYGMGVLNRHVETYRAYNNTKISAACNATGITFWNTDGWVTDPDDLSDVLHPITLGRKKF